MSRTRGFSLCIVATFTIASVMTILFTVGVPSTASAAENADICLSKECVSTASMIQKSMDLAIDPCTDFYKFSCGGFIKSEALADQATDVDFEHLLLMNLSKEISRMLNGATEPEAPKHFELVKTLYASCVNPASMGDEALEAYRNFLQAFGGWPVVEGDSWDGAHFNWRRSVHKFHQDGNAMSPVVNIHIEGEVDGANGIIKLRHYNGLIPPGTSPDNFNESPIQEYYNAIVNLTVFLGADRTRASSEIREAILFEMRLANITLPNAENFESEASVTMSIAELNEKYPSVPWMTYIEDFLGSSLKVSEKEIVTVEVPEYYVKLEALMAETPERIQANFVISRIALRNAVYSSEQMRLDFYAFFEAISGLDLDLSREKFCTSQVLANLWLSFISAFVSQYYSSPAMSNIIEMTAEIKRQWNETLGVMNLTDEAARQEAMDEANALIHEHIYYPPELLDDAKLEEFYANLEFTSNFFENMNKLAIFDHGLLTKQLRHPFDAFHWTHAFGGSSINPLIIITSSYIPIPAVLLRGMHASPNQPRYLGYGVIGKSIGYDISRSHDWSMKENFAGRARCIIDQHKKYRSDDSDPEDAGTLDEDIADLMGTKVAYLGYIKWASRNNAREQKLPGLEKYSPEQMFWISVAASQCMKYTKENWELLTESEIKNDHSPAKFRVVGPISNIQQFADDFKCSDDSPMRARKNCFQW